jgi:hypothetical protein
MKGHEQTQEEYFRGVPTIRYDLLKELAIAMIAVLALVLVVTAILSSPDVKEVTVQSWATTDPVDFVTTATGELAGTTVSADYGAPYNGGSGSVQSLGPISPQAWFGVHQPVDSANDFVLTPLKVHAVGTTDLATALDTYNKADDKTRQGWLDSYTKALADAKADQGGITLAQGDYGPLPVMMDNLLNLAESGALDGMLLSQGGFYQTDYTRPLLFMGDGGYLSGLADTQKLTGSQWGMMNETGMYPGQTWLWLYTFWYQVPPFTTPGFPTDLGVVLMMTVLSLGLLLIPFIPGLRDIPYWIPIHKLIWRTQPPAGGRDSSGGVTPGDVPPLSGPALP